MAAKFHFMAHLYKAFVRFGIFWADLASALVRMSQTIFLPKINSMICQEMQKLMLISRPLKKMPKSKEKSD
jgi:hypothetical protein